MSVSGISNAERYQDRFQQIKTDFQQLGSDLKAGTLGIGCDCEALALFAVLIGPDIRGA